MMTYNISIFNAISEAKEFGINFDIFETNILNLSVVIGVLVYYGRIALNDLVSNRKNIIMKNLQEADNKFNEAIENLEVAKNNFEQAKLKSEKIRAQGLIISKQAANKIFESLEEEVKRAQVANLSAIKLEEEKSIKEVCKNLSSLAFTRAVENISKKLNANLHKKIVYQNIDKLSGKSFGNIKK